MNRKSLYPTTSSSKDTFCILLADDHAIVRVGLRIVIGKLDPTIQVDEASDAESIIFKLRSNPFDLLILDINMRNLESFRFISRIRREFPALLLLIYTLNNELIFASRFLQIGVHGYLLKEATEAEILDALNAIISGKIYISDALARQLIGQRGRGLIHPFDALSNREFEVVLLLAKGNPTAEIARALHVSPSTVGTHKNRIMKKLKLSNTIELLDLAREYRLL